MKRLSDIGWLLLLVLLLVGIVGGVTAWGWICGEFWSGAFEHVTR